MTINEIQDQIIEEFSMFEDWLDKYNIIIGMGNSLEPFPEEHRVVQNLIEGCQSKVWLHAEYTGGKVYFKADSDAIITKGIAAMLLKVFSGKEPGDIIQADLYFIDRIGLKQNLSPTRSNGLLSMVKQMKYFALAFKSKK